MWYLQVDREYVEHEVRLAIVAVEGRVRRVDLACHIRGGGASCGHITWQQASRAECVAYTSPSILGTEE